MKDETLFDKNILEGTIPKLPSGLRIRPLQLDDYYNGFLQLLTQLTSVGEVSFEKFGQQFNAMKNANPQAYYVIVIEEESTKKIVGASTLVIELKFIHEAGCRGRVEDVVVASSMRGLKLGATLNSCLVALAKKLSVYKLSLECKDKLVGFYEQFGYNIDHGNNFLVQRFDSKI
ncbi:hypothetical protein QR680_000026 [Steinernema hermaphroditum]|uniref:Glucosamine 6-phosphate N-acetyltransferase n=1 Tax=Steinernema hermaphroditum TaxID=289476 RepID=A0AA39LDC9_9BILA|nr:hypothetical protein QR680_000026 [Steinernema hermaphroditum]